MVRTLQAESSMESGQTSSSDVSAANLQMPAPDLTPAGHLSTQSGAGVRYVGSTFWASICNEVTELDELLSRQVRHSVASAAITSDVDEEQSEDEQGSVVSDLAEDDATSYRREAAAEPFTLRTVAQNPNFLKQLPPKAVFDKYVEGYIRGYHPLVPLIHIPSFRKRYEDFWRTRDDPNASSTASMAFASLLCATAYAGSVACPDRITITAETSPTPEDVSTHFHKLGLKALRLANFPRTPSLDTFRAYLLCQTLWMREEEPLTCVAFVGLALRVATMLGLHKDPSHFPNIEPVEAEVRRRVWWHLVHIDVLVAIASGLPPMVELKAWDTQEISELKEEYLGTPDGMQYDLAVKSGQRPHESADDPRDPTTQSMVSTSGILVAGKLRVTLVLRQTLARLFCGGSLTTPELHAMRSDFRVLGEDLASRIARIPEPEPHGIGEVTVAASPESNVALNRWARLLLSAYIDQKYALVCHPVLKVSDSKSKLFAIYETRGLTIVQTPVGRLWTDLYPQAIERCQSFVTKCAQMTAVEEFRHYQWSWPGHHQPLHAMMILLMDLVQNPTDPANHSAVSSRRAIDIIFALNGPDGGLVAGSGSSNDVMKRPLTEGGRETWDFLRRLRNRAWHLAGLDPTLAWTREQAIRYCNDQTEFEARSHSSHPPWTQGNPEVAEEPLGGDERVGNVLEGVGNHWSSPNIDWAYLDEVLRTGQQPVDPFDFGELEGLDEDP